MVSGVDIGILETPQQAARRFSEPKISAGYHPEALHSYYDRAGQEVYHRIRLKHPNGDKWIRPMYRTENGQYQLVEPPDRKGLPKILYGLPYLDQYANATICIVEGEWSADKLNHFFLEQNALSKYFSITSGGSTSAASANWEPLAGRTCILWADNDEPGEKYINEVSGILIGLGCSIKQTDVAALRLPVGGDCVDWLKQ